jgi:hypothetical protein
MTPTPLPVDKVCSRCNQRFLGSHFFMSKVSADGLEPWCKPCRNEYRRQWYNSPKRHEENLRYKRDWTRKNLARVENHRRRSELRRNFGITQETYDKIVEAQGNRCGLCGTDAPGGHGTWHVDHCHETGAVHGLLCHVCNTQLGVYLKVVARTTPEQIAAWLKLDWRS